MNIKTPSLKAAILAPVAILLAGIAAEVHAAPFCSHGRGIISEDNGFTTYATRLIKGDFDGDGTTDSFCKDVRKDDSNGNRLLEWLVLGNGTVKFSAVWNEWCTHRNSRIQTIKRGGKTILTCRDQNYGYWERELL